MSEDPLVIAMMSFATDFMPAPGESRGPDAGPKGACNKESYHSVFQGGNGCDRHRIWTHRRRHLDRDHRGRSGSRNEPEGDLLIGFISTPISNSKMTMGILPVDRSPHLLNSKVAGKSSALPACRMTRTIVGFLPDREVHHVPGTPNRHGCWRDS